MTKLHTICILFVFIFWSPLTRAGGFFYTLDDGTPYTWQTPTEILIHPESGSCGDFSNDEMIAMIEDVLANWANISDVNLGFTIAEDQIGEIDESNYDDAFRGKTGGADNDYTPFNTIIFDDDGAINIAKYGCENLGQHLGSTSITDKDENTGFITRAAFSLNCACLRESDPILCDTDNDGTDDFDPCATTGLDYTENFIRAIFQHEMGHFLNLDHTPLYEDLFETEEVNFVPLMYPFYGDPDRNLEPKQDDIIALASMYPADSFDDSYCTVTGTLLDQADNELQCATIAAIHTDKSESTSFVTGATAPGTALNGDNDRVDYNTTEEAFESTSERGKFVLKLRPEESYQITVAAINTLFVGTAQVLPCRNDQHATCTAEILDLCNDGDENTECEPCVADDILITTAEYNSLYRDSCTPGATIELGNLTAPDADSISLETALNLNGIVTVDNDDDNDVTSSGGCQLGVATSATSTQIILLEMALAILALIVLKNCKWSDVES